RLRQVRLRAQRGAEVDVGVACEPQRARVGDAGQQAQRGTDRERPGEELVLTGEKAQARQYQSRIHAHDPIGALAATWPTVPSQPFQGADLWWRLFSGLSRALITKQFRTRWGDGAPGKIEQGREQHAAARRETDPVRVGATRRLRHAPVPR